MLRLQALVQLLHALLVRGLQLRTPEALSRQPLPQRYKALLSWVGRGVWAGGGWVGGIVGARASTLIDTLKAGGLIHVRC